MTEGSYRHPQTQFHKRWLSKICKMQSKVFQSFREFFEAFGRVRTHSDPFGPIGMHSDAFGSNWKHLGVFETFWDFLGFLSCFSTFLHLFFRKNFFHGTIITSVNLNPTRGLSTQLVVATPAVLQFNGHSRVGAWGSVNVMYFTI